MMRILVMTVFFLYVIPGYGQDERFVELSLQQGSRLMIGVETNVNKFQCHFAELGQLSDLCFNGRMVDNEILFEEAVLKLPVSEFDCGNRVINSDFLELLDYRDHPHIKVAFEKAHWYSTKIQETHKRVGQPIGYFLVNITIAGTTRQKSMGIFSTHLKDDRLFSKGTLEIDMREFGLEPPVKFLGMVKVKELLNIHFDLNMLQVD